jgi:membrane fusion protein, multidrug efflux system
MKKRIIFSLVAMVVVIGVLGGIKGLQINRMIAQGSQFVPPPEPVTTAPVVSEPWESFLTSVGSLEAVEGITVSAELSGKVVRIPFEAGSRVRAGDILMEQDTTSEAAQLRSAEAAVALKRLEIERSRALLAKRAISKAQYDSAEAQFKQAVAEADIIRAVIGKKTVRAPFDGRLGIRLINLGQILKEGAPIVSLQKIDPIFVNFSLPQQQLSQIRPDLTVRITTDALPGRAVEGKITAINPEIDATTRNVRVQATVENPDEMLRPGMFVNVAVVLPELKPVVAIPATAVLYAPYSDSVFVLEEKKTGKVVRQQFVRLGEKRGDFVAVVSGVKAGSTVVSTGVFKLRNGQAVVVDNRLAPEFKIAPKPGND